MSAWRSLIVDFSLGDKFVSALEKAPASEAAATQARDHSQRVLKAD